MERVSSKQLATLPIEFKLNGKTVVGRPDELIIETARQNGIAIPHLCYSPTLRPDGNCRACVIEIKGERALAPSCCRYPAQGMEVTTDSVRALASIVPTTPAARARSRTAPRSGSNAGSSRWRWESNNSTAKKV